MTRPTGAALRAIAVAAAALAGAPLLVVGCGTQLASAPEMGSAALEIRSRSPDRQIVRSGDLSVAVASPEQALAEVERLVEQAGGMVERSTTAETRIRLTCRVPAARLEPVMDAVAALGSEQHRSVSAADVTEQYVDLDTRLRNDLALRERLQQLLARASDVEDVLAIETELNRIQSEIETRQALLDRLKLDVEQSAVSITLERERILGPLGYVGWGLWWALSKLFVIR